MTSTYKPKDLVWDTSTTQGTGNFQLAGVSPQINYRPPKDVYVVGDTFDYKIAAINRNDWEIGLATWLGGNQMQRTVVYDSSNSGALVNFRSGTKNVWGDFPAFRIGDIESLHFFQATPGDDIGGALNGFMAALADTVDAAGLSGGTVLLPTGSFYTSVPIYLPSTVSLEGRGERTTGIFAMVGSFPPSTPLITIGRPAEAICFSATVSDMRIDCQAVAGSIGVYSAKANEGCGVNRVVVVNAADTGIFYNAGSENFRNEDLEVLNSGVNGIKCIGNETISFDRVTTFGLGSGITTTGIFLRDTQVSFDNLHMEGSSNGVFVDDANVTGLIANTNGVSDITNIITFAAASPLVLVGVWKGLATTVINDVATGAVITDTYVPLWTRKLTVNSLPTTVTASFYAVLETDTTIIANRAGDITLSLPAAAGNVGRILFVKNIQSQAVASFASDVVPLIGGAAGSIILPAVAGSWVILKADNALWNIIAQSPLYVAPAIQFGATYIVLATDDTVINAGSSTLTLTLPIPLNAAGKTLNVLTYGNFAVVSDASNVETITGGGPGTAILPATAGSWATLKWRGANWSIIAAG